MHIVRQSVVVSFFLLFLSALLRCNTSAGEVDSHSFCDRREKFAADLFKSLVGIRRCEEVDLEGFFLFPTSLWFVIRSSVRL